MRRWDSLVDKYIKVCETRGLAESTIKMRTRELVRFGNWVKRKRPKPKLEQIGSDLLVGCISVRGAFRARATVYGTVSELRGMGEFLVEEGIWLKNPMRWIRGPKMDQRRSLPKRINKGHMKALWGAALRRPGEHDRYQAVSVLAILYGTGGRQRSIPVPSAVWTELLAYLIERGGKLGPLFRTLAKRTRISSKDVGRAVSDVVLRATISGKVTPRTLRHSFGTHLMDAGTDELTARDILEYVDYLRRERRNGPSAVNRQVTILKNFYRALVAMGQLDHEQNPLADRPRGPGFSEAGTAAPCPAMPSTNGSERTAGRHGSTSAFRPTNCVTHSPLTW